MRTLVDHVLMKLGALPGGYELHKFLDKGRTDQDRDLNRIDVVRRGKNVAWLTYHPGSDGDYTWIRGMEVKPEHRGKGLAKALMEEAAKDNAGKELRLRAKPFRDKPLTADQLKEIYGRLGFVEYDDEGRMRKTGSELFHGSSLSGLARIEPRPSRVLGGEAAAFATPDRDLAISFLAPWRDEDIQQGYINGEPYMREQYPGAFDRFKGAKGSLYRVAPEGFAEDGRLMKVERVSRQAADVLGEEVIDDVWEALKKTRFKLLRHGA